MAEETAYKKHFRSMMAQDGYNDPSDIPSDKKKQFFKKVDRNWHAKDEGGQTTMTRAIYIQALIEAVMPPVEEGAGKAVLGAGVLGGGIYGARKLGQWVTDQSNAGTASGSTIGTIIGNRDAAEFIGGR